MFDYKFDNNLRIVLNKLAHEAIVALNPQTVLRKLTKNPFVSNNYNQNVIN